MSPESNSSNPLIDLNRVVLPQPEGPSNVINSFSYTFSEILSNAITLPPSGVLNFLFAEII